MPAAIPFIEHAQEGETVDALVWRVLRRGSPAIEQVLKINPNLADHGVFLPRGTPVLFPTVASAPAATPMIQLWD